MKDRFFEGKTNNTIASSGNITHKYTYNVPLTLYHNMKDALF